MFVVVHGVDIGPPAYIPPKTTAVLARAMASLSAKALLEDPDSPFHFDKLCTCSSTDKVENAAAYRAAADLATDENDLNTETVEGFATSAQSELARMSGGADSIEESGDEDDTDDESPVNDQWREDSMDLDAVS